MGYLRDIREVYRRVDNGYYCDLIRVVNSSTSDIGSFPIRDSLGTTSN